MNRHEYTGPENIAVSINSIDDIAKKEKSVNHHRLYERVMLLFHTDDV